jgi:DNA-binding CsgD family transcriptional regulator
VIRPEDTLTRRELQAVEYLVTTEGASDAVIAELMHVSVSTVRTLMAGARLKTGAENRIELLFWGLRVRFGIQLHALLSPGYESKHG